MVGLDDYVVAYPYILVCGWLPACVQTVAGYVVGMRLARWVACGWLAWLPVTRLVDC